MRIPTSWISIDMKQANNEEKPSIFCTRAFFMDKRFLLAKIVMLPLDHIDDMLTDIFGMISCAFNIA